MMILDKVYNLYTNLQKFFSDTYVLYQVLQQSIYKYFLLRRLIDVGILEKGGHRRDNPNLTPTIVITKTGIKTIRYKRISNVKDRGVKKDIRRDISLDIDGVIKKDISKYISTIIKDTINLPEFLQKLPDRLSFLINVSNDPIFKQEVIQERLQYYKQNPDTVLKLNEFTEEFNKAYQSISDSIRNKVKNIQNYVTNYKLHGSDKDKLISYLQIHRVKNTIKQYNIQQKNMDITYYIQNDKRVLVNRYVSEENELVKFFKELKSSNIKIQYKSGLFDEEISQLEQVLKKYHLYDRYINEFESFKNYLQYIIFKGVMENIDRPHDITLGEFEPVLQPIYRSVNVDNPSHKINHFINFLKEKDPELFNFISYLYNHGLLHFVHNIPDTKGIFYPHHAVIALSTVNIKDEYDFVSTLFHEIVHLFSSIRYSTLDEADDINQVMFKFFSLLSKDVNEVRNLMSIDKLHSILDDTKPSTIHDITDIVNVLFEDNTLDELYQLFLHQIRENMFSVLKVQPGKKRISSGKIKEFLKTHGVNTMTLFLLGRTSINTRDLNDDILSRSIYSLVDEIYAESITGEYMYEKFGEEAFTTHVQSLAYHYDPINLSDFEMTVNYFHTYRQILEGLLDGKPEYYSMLLMHILQFV